MSATFYSGNMAALGGLTRFKAMSDFQSFSGNGFYEARLPRPSLTKNGNNYGLGLGGVLWGWDIVVTWGGGKVLLKEPGININGLAIMDTSLLCEIWSANSEIKRF